MEEPFQKPDPFEESEETEKDTEKRIPGKNKTSAGRKAAYTAVSSALSVIAIVTACYLPVTVLPLITISLAVSVVADKCGAGWGVLSMAVSAGIGTLACFGHVGIMIVAGLVFYPFSLLCIPLRPFDYSSVKGVVIRVLSMTALASLSFLGLFLLASQIADFINLEAVFERIGTAAAYVVLNVALAAAFVIVDWTFLKLVKIIGKRIR